MRQDDEVAADSTAVRVALWRALHTEVDAPPHVLADTVGLRLADPEEGWRARGDMDPDGTRTFRAGVVARARFVEDLLAERVGAGVDQYVLLGAGLDTFVQRRPELAARLRVFEIDRPGAVKWKRRRLNELGLGVPEGLRLVPVDFEAGAPWPEALAAAGFAAGRPAVVSSAGVSMYLSKEANAASLRDMASLAPGTTVVMTFQLPLPLLADGDREARADVERRARASGTPFVSFFSPEEMLGMARAAGFGEVRHVAAPALSARCFGGRPDGLAMSTGEDILVATV